MAFSRSKIHIWRLAYAIPVWAAMVSLDLVLSVVGLPLIAALLLLKKYGPEYNSIYNHERIQFLPSKLFFIWNNLGDGVLGPPEYTARYPSWSPFKRAFIWSAIRNPVNGLRFVPGLSLKIQPDSIRFFGSFKSAISYETKKREPYWYFCWQAKTYHTCLRCQFRVTKTGKMREFWIGTKIWPQDAVLPIGPFRAYRAGFALQFRTI